MTTRLPSTQPNWKLSGILKPLRGPFQLQLPPSPPPEVAPSWVLHFSFPCFSWWFGQTPGDPSTICSLVLPTSPLRSSTVVLCIVFCDLPFPPRYYYCDTLIWCTWLCVLGFHRSVGFPCMKTPPLLSGGTCFVLNILPLGTASPHNMQESLWLVYQGAELLGFRAGSLA